MAIARSCSREPAVVVVGPVGAMGGWACLTDKARLEKPPMNDKACGIFCIITVNPRISEHAFLWL